MGSLWRSAEMQLVQLFVQIEAAHDTVEELGELSAIQFRDLNANVNAFQRNFINEVKRAEEMERKLRFFESQIEKANNEREGQPVIVLSPLPLDGSESKLQMDELESKFEDLEKELQQMNNNQEMLNRNHNELMELNFVLEKDEEFFLQAAGKDGLDGSEGGDLLLKEDEPVALTVGGGPTVKLGFVTGVIPQEKFSIFERVLFRATRGNLYMKFTPLDKEIKDPHTGIAQKKHVFVVFFQGEKLQGKIKKICESFGANLYPCPDTTKERKDLQSQVSARLSDLQVVIARTLEHRRQVLNSVAQNLVMWQTKVKKEKAIYHTMNMFNYDLGRKCLIAEGWCPKNSTEDVQLALRKARDRSGALVPSILSIIKPTEEPPTYFATNKFTYAFQAIVDAYGVGRYREINPAVFTIVTFPFLFGVMFGDVGHGIMLLAFTLLLIKREEELKKQKLSEMIQTPFDGRYVMLLMSIFAIYCGFIYNEFFSVPMDIFGTNWELPYVGATTYLPKDLNRTYPIGVDPVWKGAQNELLYYNSLKMKMSIILGVTHMCVGIFLKFLNALHFKQELDIFFEFIPQMVLMLSIFGYLVFLIFFKWSIPYYLNDQNHEIGINSGQLSGDAPMLLNTMIYMFLNPFSNSEKVQPLYAGQATVQGVLVVLAGISVPMMLIPKPLILRARHSRSYVAVHDDHSHDEEAQEIEVDGGKSSSGGGGGGHGHGHGEEFDFGEVMVHQVIETIEFVLGSVSNTASYLRLWALSLAHSELATVFWDLGLMKLGVGMGPIGVIIIFAVWLGVTIGVLLVMETLSAFLHALRLHWVEFQNKFYKGDGRAFLPFSFRRVLSGEDDS